MTTKELTTKVAILCLEDFDLNVNSFRSDFSPHSIAECEGLDVPLDRAILQRERSTQPSHSSEL
jgi:hypothetical protein